MNPVVPGAGSRWTKESPGNHPGVSLLKGVVHVSPSVLREMWRTPRGLDSARKIAFQSFSFAEFIRIPFVLTMYETMHQGTLPGDLAPEQDTLLWQLCEDMYAGYSQGKL